MYDAYEMVVGLEVHVELKTKSKIFCACPTAFGAPPNTQCCPVCSGMPGALPVLNKKVLEYAIMAGLATNCEIAGCSKTDRKNYFYPDLPKSYQISQNEEPICKNGYININDGETSREIGITRIHIEEDAGKLLHTENGETLVDLNRSGVPLIEIVSAPDIHSAEEAVAYLKKLRAIVLYLGISDAKMNEGSLRCDVNISVRKKGVAEFGTRTEIKNINSFAFAAGAIKYEFARQAKLLQAGKPVLQETRRYNSANGTTQSMRTKEETGDYRYFPEPDLPAFTVADEEVERIKKAMPALPDARKKQYSEEYCILPYHSEMLVLNKAMADYFEETAVKTAYPRQLAMLLITEVFRLAGGDDAKIEISPANMAKTADFLGEGKINNQGAKALIEHLWANGGEAEKLLNELGIMQNNSKEYLKTIAEQVIQENEKIVQDYLGGKQAALKALMGAAMKKTKGNGNPKVLTEVLQKHLGSGVDA